MKTLHSLSALSLSFVVLSFGCARGVAPSVEKAGVSEGVAADRASAGRQRLPEYAAPISAAIAVDRPEVERFVKRYTTAERTHLSEMLTRREQIRPTVEPVLRNYGLPSELLNIALLESGFQNHVRSPMGAAGIWQLVPVTAKKYGLRVGGGADERLDNRRSTEAVSQYFVDLYGMFQDWNLVIGAYNCGEGAMRRALEGQKERDIFVLAKKGVIKKETSDLVGRFLAVTKISRNPSAYGFGAGKDRFS